MLHSLLQTLNLHEYQTKNLWNFDFLCVPSQNKHLKIPSLGLSMNTSTKLSDLLTIFQKEVAEIHSQEMNNDILWFLEQWHILIWPEYRSRPSKSHNFTMRLTVLYVISRFHGLTYKFHSEIKGLRSDQIQSGQNQACGIFCTCFAVVFV